MARFRVYTSKNSVIFEDDTDRNVGTNEVFELWYGTSGVTRAVQKWDFTEYNALVNAGTAPALTASTVDSVTATLVTAFRISESASTVGDASYVFSFADPSLTDFQEGTGWWHDEGSITGFSNWNDANASTAWATAGATAATIDVVSVDRDAGEIPFEFLGADLTTAWNFISSGDAVVTNVAFAPEFEALTGQTPGLKRLFFSRYTNTIFQPYIEIDWDDQVTEDRTEVVENVSTPLYLFVYSGGTLVDPQSVDSVDILGSNYTSISKVATGIYRYDYTLPVGSGGTGTVINDVWNITFDGSLTGTITQTFTGVSFANSTLWSGDTVQGQKYLVSISNLAEEYTTGDTVYFKTLFRREFSNTYYLHKNAEFRIHIPDKATGEPALIMYDWSPISYRNENFFIVGLSWFLVGREYQIDIRYSDGQQTIIDDTERRFKVTS